jgi:hypothetical protein
VRTGGPLATDSLHAEMPLFSRDFAARRSQHSSEAGCYCRAHRSRMGKHRTAEPDQTGREHLEGNATGRSVRRMVITGG